MSKLIHEAVIKADVEPTLADILRKASLLGAAAVMAFSATSGIAVGAMTYRDISHMKYENIGIDTLTGDTAANK